MKYVDEFRDRTKAEVLIKEIEAIAAAIDRPLSIMEVCGGHTHSIFRYGIEGMLPKSIELVHGPGCPVCVLPMGRVDDCVSIAERPEVIFTTFGDAMRVPGSKRSLLQAKAAGADVRIVYSPLDALAIARANPSREVVFFGLGFETTMPSTALTVLQAEADGTGNFSVFCNHITIVPTIRAILDSPDMRIDGFLGPGHVSMVIGIEPYAFIASAHKKPMVVSGFEPLDILQSLWMVLKQIAEGRAEIENQYARVAPDSGNAAALRAVSLVYEIRPFFEWRGLGSIDHSGVRLREAYAQFDAEKKFAIPNVRVEDPKDCQCGEVLKGAIKPWQCRVFGTACTPETPLGALMVSSEGSCAAYYQVQRRQVRRMRAPGRVNVDTVTMAHGGGGKAMKDLIDDVFLAAFAREARVPPEDQARFDLAELARHGDRLAFTTDAFVVDPLYFPGGDIGKLAVCGTVNDLAVGGAIPLYLSCAAIIEEGVSVDLLRDIARSMARTARDAGVAIVTGDTKVVPKGACDKLFLTTTGIGVIRDGVHLGVGRARPGDIVLVNGELGHHGAAVLCARGDMALDTAIESDCACLHDLIGALLAAAPGVRSLRDATRGGLATVLNEFADAAGVAIEIDEAVTPLREDVKAFCEILGLDPLYLANEGKIVAIVPAAEAATALAAMRAHPLGIGAAIIGRVTDGVTGRVTMRTVFGGRRIVDMLVGDQLPRIC